MVAKRTKPLEMVDPEKREIASIEQLLQKGQYTQVIAAADAFQSRNPFSMKIQKARYYKGNALEELERYAEAAEVYRIISLFSERNQPEISALAVYRLSFVYEAQGDDQRVLTTLLEARQYQTYLPTEVSLAEIPSRISMIYAKENNPEQARRWLAEAETGLAKLLVNRREPLTSDWLAKIYYNMGSVSTSQLSRENVLTIIQGQRAVQKFMLRSMQYEDPEWSSKAEKRLQTTYTDIWNLIENLPETVGVEAIVAAKMKREQQVQLAEPFSDMLKDALLFRPADPSKSNIYQKEFFAFLAVMQTKISGVMQGGIYTPVVTEPKSPAQRPKPKVQVPASIFSQVKGGKPYATLLMSFAQDLFKDGNAQ
ncbi:MAG: tetratricopeptide repeat protein [Proteobacteria bacterium]|nr:MAG: tetratricopeptide repeat protein [Pseudomonadota bacterium]